MPSAFLAHVYSYPVVASTTEKIIAMGPVKDAIAKTSPIIDAIAARTAPFVQPVKPLLAKADKLGDSSLTKLDSFYPSVKAKIDSTEPIIVEKLTAVDGKVAPVIKPLNDSFEGIVTKYLPKEGAGQLTVESSTETYRTYLIILEAIKRIIPFLYSSAEFAQKKGTEVSAHVKEVYGSKLNEPKEKSFTAPVYASVATGVDVAGEVVTAVNGYIKSRRSSSEGLTEKNSSKLDKVLSEPPKITQATLAPAVPAN
ncbi:hypothetical protein CANCADRAFT_104701 [Tortispora caseinolytica NRRL Y-17796]|uniref:Uncharacterized protein n=1 Tax=Tortispora caseinolytica NRRL Y-17796 TaxID=767744 RepID=A0A1E4TEV6_9ASCO|nr:hypothetical protein CANCADRAFT_104701 [Tortispora caseinolytica NRRL Y-17796]